METSTGLREIARGKRFLMLNWRDPRNPMAGGAERVSRVFLRGLVERGHEVHWFTHAFPGCEPEETIDGIRIHRAGGRFSSIVAANRWYRQRPRFDLVIDQHHGIPWYAPWWSGTRCLAYIHEVLGPIWRSFYRWPTSEIGRVQERWTHWFYRRVPFWVPSESTRAALRRAGVRDVHLFPNGVDVEPLEVLPDKPCGTPVRLITVSRLAPNKRVCDAIRCVGVLRARGVQVELAVVGGGSELEALKRLVVMGGLTGSVRFCGFEDESVKLQRLADAHLLLHPSVREGWGLNVIEANAVGTPAVVYPVDGLVDSTVNGVTGVVAREETPESLADGVMSVVSEASRYGTMRGAAWERSKGFRWGVVVPQVTTFLEKLAAGPILV